MEDFPCPHRKAGTNLCETLPDYHPLTKEEICILLERARLTKNLFVNLRVCTRLAQGIKGMVCPRPEEGPLSLKMLKVHSLFLRSQNGEGVNSQLVNELHEIMVG